jgi:hypothetical protein
MEFAEFRPLVDAFLVEHARLGPPAGMQLVDEALKASDDDMSFAEARLGSRLPEKYKEVMRVYGAGPFVFVELLPVRARREGVGDLVRENTGEFAVVDFVAVAPVGIGDM